MLRLAQAGTIAALALALAGCGGGASAPAAKPSTAAPAGSAAAAKPAGSGAAAAVPSANVVGQKAPGPYTANGSGTVSNGSATMEATDTLKWQPNTLVVKGGDKVSLTIHNPGSTAHTFVSPGLNVGNAVDVPNGKDASVSFTAPTAPGAYQFWCNIPGHAEAGMVGEVIVQ